MRQYHSILVPTGWRNYLAHANITSRKPCFGVVNSRPLKRSYKYLSICLLKVWQLVFLYKFCQHADDMENQSASDRRWPRIDKKLKGNSLFSNSWLAILYFSGKLVLLSPAGFSWPLFTNLTSFFIQREKLSQLFYWKKSSLLT